MTTTPTTPLWGLRTDPRPLGRPHILHISREVNGETDRITLSLETVWQGIEALELAKASEAAAGAVMTDDFQTLTELCERWHVATDLSPDEAMEELTSRAEAAMHAVLEAVER